MSTTDNKSPYRAPALDKGLDILELLAQQPAGLTRAEIVKAMGRGPSEIYRMLERLVMREYVARSIEGDRYTLSMKLFILSNRHPPLRRLVSQAQPLMDQFAIHSKQSLHLVAPDRGSALVLAQSSPPGDWEFRVRVGVQIDLFNTSSGITLLAFLEDEHREELFAEALQAGWKTPDKQALYEYCEHFKKQGHQITNSKQLVGVQDISVPIRSPYGEGFAALTCPYVQRLEDRSDFGPQKTLEHLLVLAQTLSID